MSQLEAASQSTDLECFCEDDAGDGLSLPGVAGQRIVNQETGEEADAACGTGKRYKCPNVFRPPAKFARHGRQVFWRVDTVMTSDFIAGGNLHVVRGEVWSFSFAPFPAEEPKPIVCPGDPACIAHYYPATGNMNFSLPGPDVFIHTPSLTHTQIHQPSTCTYMPTCIHVYTHHMHASVHIHIRT